MENGASFIDELLEEVEEKEHQQTEVYMDILLAKVGHLEDKIASNFKSAEEEIKLINDFVLSKNSKIQGQIDGIKSILSSFIEEKGEKTISLPHGTLKLHKKPDKFEVTDLDLFLKYATNGMLTTVPESYKPSISKIKSYHKMTGKLPMGVTKTEGTNEFKLTINKQNKEN